MSSDVTPSGNENILEDIISGLISSKDEAEGTFAPRLIANHQGSTMGDALRNEIAASNGFTMSVAFVSENALKSMFQALLDSNHRRTNASRIITSTKNYFNNPKAFKELMKLQREAGVEVLIWNGTNNEQDAYDQPFHPKGYVFSRRMSDGEPYYNLYVGSSNLTCAALGRQREWNLRVSSLGQADLIHEVHDEIDSQIAQSVPLTDDWIAQYEKDFQKIVHTRQELLEETQSMPIEPNAMQCEALENLEQLRVQGERRAIVISATGTGKTYLSAFDVRSCNPRRMLYVANRKQILTSAMKSYKRVLGADASDYGLFTGDSVKQYDCKYTFASVDTLRNHLEEFAPDDFDYVLIDEVHHAGAQGYRSIIDYFSEADFMLGMTATPERSDGIDIFSLFDHNVAYEIRLQQALDANMLCPFHYYGVAELLTDDAQFVDVEQGMSSSQKAALQHTIRELTCNDRVRYIIDKLQQYGSYDQPVTGLVFCSCVEEAQRLSDAFNRQINQQAERMYKTRALFGSTPQQQRDHAIEQLEQGELDYIFTVDLFNEGIDIPAINQIVMLRNTQSSIVFTQQLGRGLRKFPDKSCVTVIDFIGNYANNYLIPVALYGNAGDRDTNRKNMQKQQLGLCSVSFDEIARERVLRSLDVAKWSDMRRLEAPYMQMRYELGRIPMLADIHMHDPSLVLTMSTAKKSASSGGAAGNYAAFVQSVESKMGKGSYKQETSLLDTLDDIDETENAVLKMATEILLPGLRPFELVILDELWPRAYSSGGCRTSYSCEELYDTVRLRFPQAYITREQFDSAIRVLDYSYFDATDYKRFGGTPLINVDENNRVTLSNALYTRVHNNSTVRLFFEDCIRTGLLNYKDLLRESSLTGRSLEENRGFVYEHKYKLAHIARLLGWRKQVNGQNIGGYKKDDETGTMPIMIKYDNSQYADHFLNEQEMHWYSKAGRTPQSPEFQWLSTGQVGSPEWLSTHFIPLFIMRKDEKESNYYYVGYVTSFTPPQLVVPSDSTEHTAKHVTTTDLHLNKPIDMELMRHLTQSY